jgi:putative acetyltransferase
MSRTRAPRAPVEVRDEPLSSPVARGLIAALNAELLALYPPEECFHDLAENEVAPGQGRFLVAWEGDLPVGCGAIRRLEDGRAELKRMYVVAERRGRGISRAVLEALEATARALGASSIVLETGVRQPAAIGLYGSAGYVPIPAFGAYVTSASSLCMERRIDGVGRA